MRFRRSLFDLNRLRSSGGAYSGSSAVLKVQFDSQKNDCFIGQAYSGILFDIARDRCG